ncbi:MAG: right-handed parallel beta-helix repeat-containing protein, partial [Thermoplasmatota archaeon]
TRISVNSDNVVFNNFTVRNAPGDFWTNAITVYDDDYVRISNCTITQCDGLTVWNSSNVRIENCNISDSLRGMDIDFGCNDVTIRNCIISHNLGEKEGGGYLGGFGIDIEDNGSPTTNVPTTNVSITNCSISHNRFWSILMYGGYNLTVSNCRLDGNGAGVILTNAGGVTVSHCHIYGKDLGIDVTNSTQIDIKNCSIQSDDIGARISHISPDMLFSMTGCNITESKQGIYLYACRGISLDYNNIWENEVGLLAELSICDARYNYWGSELGPSRLLGLRGDRIMNRLPSVIRYFPWLTEEYEPE